jgi:hypothetical protein
MSSRPRFRFPAPLLAVLLAVLGTLLVPAAADDAVELGLERMPTLGMVRLTASGIAFDGCLPAAPSVSAEGSMLVLRALTAERDCLDSAQPYSLRSDLLVAAPAESGLYRVRLELQSTPASIPWLEAFALIPARPETATLVPESGFWWGELGGEFGRGAPGFGVLVEVQGETVAVSVSGYDEFGNPEWLMGAAPLGGRAVSLSLGRLQGGSGPHGGFRSPQRMQEAGRLHIEWLGSARALFWFERPAGDGFGIDLVPVSMVRFGFAGDSGEQWLGRWLLAAERDFAEMPAPRTLDLVAVESSADGFILRGVDGEQLECSLDRSRPHSPPEVCRLQFGQTTIDFDDVALRRLQARRADALSLIRLDR